MAQVDITLVNNQVIVEWLGGENPRKRTFSSLSLSLTPTDKISLYEDGNYKTQLAWQSINEIDGVAPTSYDDAFTKLQALIPSSSGGGGGAGSNYNNVTVYDTPANLPITFAGGTIHSISMLCLTGTLTVTIGGEQTVLQAGQSTSVDATTLIVEAISLDSTTGTFLVTTLD